MLEQVQLLDPKRDECIKIDNLEDLVFYVQSQIGAQKNRSSYLSEFGFNHPDLIKLHNEHPCLYVDKYLSCSIPDVQIEFLLESQGINEDLYTAYLGKPDRDGVVRSKFWVNFCRNSQGVLSELITPVVDGGKFNPYVRLNSSKISGSQTLNKIQDLACMGCYDPDSSGPSLFNLLVLTFPWDVGKYLLIPNKRDWVISKMWKCFFSFFKQLRFLFGLDPSESLGCNVSLHLWSSEFPVLPHPHFHMVFPHFKYLNITKRYREDVEFVFDDLYEKLYSCNDKHMRWVIKKELSEKLKQFLFFEKLECQGPELESGNRLPLDVGLIRFIWSEVVNEEFGLGNEEFTKYDIFSEFVKYNNKPKLLHYLQYKNRPVILDLDLFFKKCSGVVNGYGSGDLCFDRVVSFVRSLFVDSALKGDINKTNRYESVLQKLEEIVARVPQSDLFSWLQFLVTWRTQTRVFGFWNYLCWYRVTSILRGELPCCFSCPICGGELEKTLGCNDLYIDFIIVNNRSRFLVFDFKGPPSGVG